MSAYKKLNQQDAYISTYTSRKSWVASGSQYAELGINNIKGLSGYEFTTDYSADMFVAGNQATTSSTAFNCKLIYESINHLYFEQFDKSILTTTSSYENYLQSSFEVSGSRHINERIAIFSLPKEMYGTHIEPLSVSITPDLFNGTNEGTGSLDNYFDNNYSTDEGVNSVAIADNLYTENTEFLFGSNNPGCTITEIQTDFIENEGTYVNEVPDQYIVPTNVKIDCNEIIDDGEGRLFFKFSSPRKYVGNVIYTHGQLIITDEAVATYYNYYFNAVLKWKSNLPIYTHNYHCRVKSNELNYSLNKTTLVNSDGLVKGFVTGSEFNPYFTSVGLYNDSNELMAVAKLGRPTPKSLENDMSIVVKLDMNFGSNRLLEGRVTSSVETPETLPPCELYFTFRNYYSKSGYGQSWGLMRSQNESKRIYRDRGGYELFRKRAVTTALPADNFTAPGSVRDFEKISQFEPSQGMGHARCYVDVTVTMTINASGERSYSFEYFEGPINSRVTYDPNEVGNAPKRQIAFFRDKILSYLLENNPSCDFGVEVAGTEGGGGDSIVSSKY